MSASLTLKEQSGLTISSIAVKTDPTKTSYSAGEYFDPTGMVLTITYSDNTTEDIATWTATQHIPLAANATSVLINWNDEYLLTYNLPQAENDNLVGSAKVGTAQAG